MRAGRKPLSDEAFRGIMDLPGAERAGSVVQGRA
jgi:hypothetical protein